MSDERYNGWTNRETWLVKLWIDNEEGSQRYWKEETKRVWATDVEPRYDRSGTSRVTLADLLQNQFDDASYDLLDDGNAAASFWADLLGTALGRVNWREIAASMLDDAELEGYEPHKEIR